MFCEACGKEIEVGLAFCPHCGKSTSDTTGTDDKFESNQFNAEASKMNATKEKSLIKVIVGAVLVATVIVAGVLVVPKLFVSVEDLCAQGKYEEAYEKADADEKLEIKAENAAAVQSAFSVDNLKDPNSFVLRDAYYKEGKNDDGAMNKQLVLYISGANSYGASVSSYWLYTWDAEEDDWSYFCSVSDLSEEEYNSYDDEDERLEKLLNNIGRTSIKNTMNDGIKLSKDAVKRINAMFEADILDDVKLLDVD